MIIFKFVLLFLFYFIIILFIIPFTKQANSFVSWMEKLLEPWDMYSISEDGNIRFFDNEIPSKKSKLNIIWNVPSFQCDKYKLNFTQVAEWGIIQNHGDHFRGDDIALLYDPGLFPALLTANTASDLIYRNGGVPQEGNITQHLLLFSSQIDKLIPDENFSGVGIIDFEHWRPIWDENFGSLTNYRKVSRCIERKRHPFWTINQIESEATKRFEKAAWQFLSNTLTLAKKLRPKALWGYYGYPLCFNYTPRNNHPSCSASVRNNNDRLGWLFEESSGLYPSLYLKEQAMSVETRALFMKGRMNEAIRLSRQSLSKPSIYSYTWLKYHDTKDFLSQKDLYNSLGIPWKVGASGVILWGSSNDVNTHKKCVALRNYVDTILGPTVKRILTSSQQDISIPSIVEKPVFLEEIIDTSNKNDNNVIY